MKLRLNMKRHYKIGIIGFGSIGSRHLNNIVNVLEERECSYSIDLIRSGVGQTLDRTKKKFIDEIFYSYEEVPHHYDVIFVTNPTYLHFDTIRNFVSKTKHMFIEKPIFNNINVFIEDLGLKDDGIYYVACPIRYTEVIQFIKHKIDLSMIYCARVICSSYLPEWRPNKDYRLTYSAKKSEGGGVSIDLIHEWDYLYYLFGLPEKVINIRGKFSALEIDSDDLSLYLAKYERMAAEIHLDYFGRKPLREIQLFSAEDTIVGDLINSEIRFLKSGEVITFNESRNDFQQKEIAYFFDILEGKESNHNDILTAMNTLKIATEGVE
jgi:predicted dehydrogenase